MGARESDIADYACSREGPTRHAILIDPADQTPDMAAKRSLAAVAAGSSMVLVGGSSDTDMENVHETVVAIQEALELVEWASTQDAGTENLSKAPVVLFPQGAAALSPAADAITFMMLMNSTKREFLVGEQVRGAPYLQQFGVEALPTGYVVCAPGGRVGEVGAAELIQPTDTELVEAYALCAKMYGFSLLYLEAGSGATSPVHPDLIAKARSVDGLTLLVGGGLRSGEDVARAVSSGADWIVTGTVTEDATSLDELRTRLTEIIKACSA